MISVLNRLPVFRILLMFFWLVLGAQNAYAAKKQHPLVWAGDQKPSAKENSWLKEDRGWLRSLSEGHLAGNLPDPFSASADSVAMLRKWVTRTAKADSIPHLRPVTSLLRDRWVDRGYLGARVSGRDTLFIHSGPQYQWAELVVSGETFTGRKHLLETWLPRSGDTYNRETLEQGIEMILLGTGEEGHPFARWITQDLVLNEEEASVSLKGRLLPGHLAVIGPISSSLPSERASGFLARATGLRHGELLRHSDLLRATDRLLARDLYTHIGTPQVYLTTSEDTVGIHFPVTERRKINQFQVVLGLSRKQEGEPSRISGEVDLRLPNMAGTGRRLGVGWRDDGNEKSWFGFSYLEPLAFGTPLDTEFFLDNEVQTDSHTRFRLDNRWRIPVVALWGVEFGFGWDRSTYPTGSLAFTSRLRGRAGILHHRGDRSRSGWSGLFALETAYRSSNLRSEDELGETPDPKLGEALTQRIITGELSGEWWVSSTVSLFNRVSYNQLSGGNGEVPLSEQFRFGGAASLRGYREDEFHGSTAAWGAVEMRIGRAGGSRLYTFYDLGYFEFSALDPQLDNPDNRSLKKGWPRGYGLGILARTPGGDISLAVGFPGTVDFDLAKLHVTLLESF
jgi:outer membrane protein assembly factor BamA